MSFFEYFVLISFILILCNCCFISILRYFYSLLQVLSQWYIKIELYTQEFLAEKINISIDLLRNIENSRNVVSIQTLLNLCNFLEITPNAMFENLYTTKDDTLDTTLQEYFDTLSTRSKKALQKIIIHLDKNY